MARNTTLLCIHRDPAQLSLLAEHGYELATATTGSEGLRLFVSLPVDAVVIEFHLGLLDGGAIADEIKRVRPELPIVMLADHVELPVDALKSVDALVVKSDGPHFLLATIHFVLKVKPLQRRESKLRSETPAHLRRTGRSREAAGHGQANAPQSPIAGKETPFSPKVWKSIRDRVIRF
jgi:DNA-binding response OmpR family regulator